MSNFSVQHCQKRNTLSRGRPCRRATSRKERIEALFEYWFEVAKPKERKTKTLKIL